MRRAFLRSLGCPCPSVNDWLGFGCFRHWIRKLTDNSCNCFLLRSGQLPLHLHRTTEGQQRRLRMWKSHWCDDGFAHLLLLLQSRPGLEFGQACFLGTFAWWWLFNRAKTRKIICDWVAWWTPPCFEYFVPFFVVIFYVISPTIAQIVVGPQSREGDSAHASSGPFLYATQDQALFRPQSQRSWPCALVQYITVATGWGRDAHLSSSGFCSSDWV